ncbi:unnamed protein product [Rodentolepis nana]|uniref:NR LBD domain-containing protein n=1 Tax=Rodentolepis nana TaxID=102285 RepID=A0A0R3TFG3_RODNA|nr:unnamed protein product [Rodentolepis nana]
MTQEVGSTGYDLRFDRHRCGIPHEKFDPQRHEDMYINLDRLPNTAPIMRFDKFFIKPANSNEEGIDIPLIIAGPIYALSELIWEEEELFTFIENLDGCSYRNPQPYNEECPVCKAVHLILTTCTTYEDCKQVLKDLKPLLIYQVCHEIWCRLLPQPIAIEGIVQNRFDAFVYSYITRFYDMSRPLGDKAGPTKTLSWPERREVMLEWTNGYAFQTHYLISKGPENSKIQRIAAGFILTFMLRFLRGYTTLSVPELSTNPNSPYFLLDAIKATYEKQLNIIDGVVLHLYPVLLFIPNCDQTEAEVKKLLKDVMRIMLTMNVQEAFMPGADIQQYYTHIKACELHPGMCICRWAKYLESNPRGSPDDVGMITCPQGSTSLSQAPGPNRDEGRVYIRRGKGIDIRAILRGF